MRAQLDASTFERRLQVTLGLPLLALVVLSAVLLGTVLQLRDEAAEVATLNRVVVQVRESEKAFQERAERLRDYFAAGDPRDLVKYQELGGNLDQHLADLAAEVGDSGPWSGRRAGLVRGIDAWRAAADADLRGQGVPGALSERAHSTSVAAQVAAGFDTWISDVRERRLALESLTRTRTERVLLATAALFVVLFGATGFLAWRSMRRLGSQYRAAWDDLARQTDLVTAANTRFETAVGVSDAVVYEWDVARDRAVLTGRVAEVLGHAIEGPVTVGWWHEHLHEEDRERAIRDFEAARLACGRYTQEYRFRRADGSWATLRNRGLFLPGPDGAAERIVGLVQDVTSQREVQRALERAERLDSVGRLAGGVAHDFNNLTTAILGYAEIAARPDARPEDVREALQAIQRAGARSAGLTAQLLSFARREVLAPLQLELDAQVREVLPLLRHGVGEAVEIEARLSAGGACVRFDPSRFESVLVNLALNARDAMPQGGSLAIETAVVDVDAAGVATRPGLVPGRHARLVVRDTGTGMTPEVLARVFEPFFTTKPRGRGTGLGLPSVHGAVSQAGGHVAVSSEPGRGTTFEILLPLVNGAPAPRDPGPAENARSAGAAILLVEDDEDVRALAASSLRRAGHHVVECADGAEALRRANEPGTAIDLLVSDVVMPGLGGPEVAEAVARLRPGVRVLFTSAYSEDAVVGNGVLAPGTRFLAKPFTPRGLIAAVRAVLDEAPARA